MDVASIIRGYTIPDHVFESREIHHVTILKDIGMSKHYFYKQFDGTLACRVCEMTSEDCLNFWPCEGLLLFWRENEPKNI